MTEINIPAEAMHDIVPAWVAAGCPVSEFNDRPASEMLRHAVLAAARLRDDPEEFESLVRGGGTWGTADDARRFVQALAEACALHPSAIVSVCR